MPLTLNGKIDVRALPDPAEAGPIEGVEPAGPRDSTERTICRVWAEVLGAKNVGLDDNFFEIGGHSLLAAKMFARLDDELGRPLPLGVLFSAPTVRQLAERIRDPGAHAVQATRALVPLQSQRHPTCAVSRCQACSATWSAMSTWCEPWAATNPCTDCSPSASTDRLRRCDSMEAIATAPRCGASRPPARWALRDHRHVFWRDGCL